MSCRTRQRLWPTIFGVGLMMTAAQVAVAQIDSLYGFDPETRIYIVQPGDTMWDISDRAYKDPWKWPRIWENNPQVANPHAIYPDGQLVMPYADGQKPPQPATSPPPAPVTEPEPAPEPEPEPEVVEPEPVEQDGADILRDYGDEAQETRISVKAKTKTKRPSKRIVVKLGGEGVLTTEERRTDIAMIGGPDNRNMYATGDLVYLSKGKEAGIRPGQQFYSYERGRELEHPDTDESLGVHLKTTGVLRVISVEPKSATAKIIESYDAIDGKQYLAEFKKRPSEIVPIFAEKQEQGKVVRTGDSLEMVATYQVIYVDRGSENGFKNGTLIKISRDQPERYDRINDVDVPVPDLKLGVGVVIDVGEKASTVLIVRSQDRIEVGDHFATIHDDG